MSADWHNMYLHYQKGTIVKHASLGQVLFLAAANVWPFFVFSNNKKKCRTWLKKYCCIFIKILITICTWEFWWSAFILNVFYLNWKSKKAFSKEISNFTLCWPVVSFAIYNSFHFCVTLGPLFSVHNDEPIHVQGDLCHDHRVHGGPYP